MSNYSLIMNETANNSSVPNTQDLFKQQLYRLLSFPCKLSVAGRPDLQVVTRFVPAPADLAHVLNRVLGAECTSAGIALVLRA
jgi:hypothetical protein